jgi:hypothetical protein
MSCICGFGLDGEIEVIFTRVQGLIIGEEVTVLLFCLEFLKPGIPEI